MVTYLVAPNHLLEVHLSIVGIISIVLSPSKVHKSTEVPRERDPGLYHGKGSFPSVVLRYRYVKLCTLRTYGLITFSYPSSG